MKLSEVTDKDLLNYLRLVPEYTSEEDKKFALACKDSAISWIKSHCNIDDVFIENNEDITIAVLVLAADMFDNRSVSSTSTNVNRTVQSILSHHDFNLVEGMNDE